MILIDTARWSVVFYNQWQFTRVRWINFNIVYLSFEIAGYKKTYEMTAGLLGLNINVTYYHGDPKP